jgi:carboxypeptidase PM20D1
MLKKTLVALVTLTAVLAAALVVRTLRFPSRQVAVAPVRLVAVDPDAAAGRLAGAVRFRTISYQDPSQFDAAQFLGLHRYLEQQFPRVEAALTREVVGDYSLLYTWKGRDETLAPLLLLAHMDVVPAEPGTEGAWSCPPFEGRIADGFVWGRGAWDDKGSMLAILEGVEALLAEGFQPSRTVLLAFGHDEEVGGTHGAMQMAALLAERGVRPECVLDEGSVVADGIVPGVTAPVALVGIAEKGFLDVELSVEGEGGHSSMPPPQTVAGVLAAALVRLERNQMPAALDGATRQMFEYVGPEMAFGPRLVFANLWLFGPLVERRLAASPATNAALRTTTAITVVEGGTKANVLPSRARAIVNFRLRPGDTVDAVLDHVRATVDDPRVRVALPAGSAPNEATAVSDTAAPSFTLLLRAIREVYPQTIAAPYLVVAATDSRHYAALTPNVYRFEPVWAGPDDLRRFHGIDERISVENYAGCVRFYAQVVRDFAG